MFIHICTLGTRAPALKHARRTLGDNCAHMHTRRGAHAFAHTGSHSSPAFFSQQHAFRAPPLAHFNTGPAARCRLSAPSPKDWVRCRSASHGHARHLPLSGGRTASPRARTGVAYTPTHAPNHPTTQTEIDGDTHTHTHLMFWAFSSYRAGREVPFVSAISERLGSLSLRLPWARSAPLSVGRENSIPTSTYRGNLHAHPPTHPPARPPTHTHRER